VRSYPRAFFLAMLVNLLFFASMHLLMVPWPLYITSLGGLTRDVGLTTAAFALTAVLARPMAGILSDRWGRRQTMFLGLLLFTVSPALFALLHTIPLLILVRMLHGVGIAAFTTAYIVLMAEMVSASQRGAALGLAGIAPSLSLMIWPPLGMPLLNRFGFTTLFLLAALLAGLGLGLALFISGRTANDEEPRRDPNLAPPDGRFLAVLQQRCVLAPTITTFTLGVAYGSVITFLPLFTTEQNLGNVGLYFSAYALAYAVSRMPLGRLSDQIGRRQVIVPCMAGVALSLGLLAFAGNLAVLILLGIVYGVASAGARAALDALVVDYAPPEVRGTAISVMYAGLDSGIGGGSALLGLWAEHVGYGGLYLTVGLVSLAGAIAFLMLTSRPLEPAVTYGDW